MLRNKVPKFKQGWNQPRNSQALDDSKRLCFGAGYLCALKSPRQASLRSSMFTYRQPKLDGLERPASLYNIALNSEPIIRLQGLSKIARDFSHDRRSSNRHKNPRPSENVDLHYKGL
jgi:hypothetical protein